MRIALAHWKDRGLRYGSWHQAAEYAATVSVDALRRQWIGPASSLEKIAAAVTRRAA